MPKTCTPAPKITLHASATGKTHLGVLKIPTYAPPHEFQKKVAFSLSHCLPSNAIQHIHIPFPTTSKNQFPCRVAALKFQPTRTHIYNEYYLAIYHPRARAAVYLPPKVFVRRALSLYTCGLLGGLRAGRRARLIISLSPSCGDVLYVCVL